MAPPSIVSVSSTSRERAREPSRPRGPQWVAWAQVFSGALSIFAMGGIVFGVSSLYSVLYRENVLLGACPAAQARACAAREPALASTKCCDEQKLQYTLLSSIALFASDGAVVLYGEVADRLGPRVCFGIGALCVMMGLVLMGINSALGNDALWYLTFFMLGVGGPGVFLGSFSLQEKHPHLRAVMTALAASFWDGSAIVFLAFNALYFGGFGSLGSISAFWLALSACLAAATFLSLPTWKEMTSLREGDAAGASALISTDESLTDNAADCEPHDESADSSGKRAAPSTPGTDRAPASFASEFFRRDTALMLLFMSVYNLKSSFFITTFSDQMASMYAPETAESLALTFNTAFPVGGFLTSAAASLLLEKCGDREDLYMAVVLGMAIAFGGLTLIPYAPAQYAAALLFGPTRTVQWACYFHFLSLPSRYSARYVGRLLGYGNLVLAIFGDGPPYALNAFVADGQWRSATDRYFAVQAVMQLAILGCLALPAHLHSSIVASIGRPKRPGPAIEMGRLGEAANDAGEARVAMRSA